MAQKAAEATQRLPSRARIRILDTMMKLIELLHIQGFTDKHAKDRLGELFGRDPKGQSTLLAQGISWTLFKAAVGRWTDKGNIDFWRAVHEVRSDLGKADQELVAAIESLFNPSDWFRDLLELYSNEASFLRELKKNREAVELIHSLDRRLRE